jgi:apolipoprotein D and lipocalin family protein
MPIRMLAALAAALLLGACAPGTVYRDTDVSMRSVDVDPARYQGRWYEIARYPAFFQRGCTDVTADYALQGDGTIAVLNTCRRGDDRDSIAGTARIVGPGQLKVRLGRIPFAGDYWVIWLDPDYRAAVVATPSGRFGWVLSRTPVPDPALLDQATAALAAAGYDTGALEPTPQAAGQAGG